MPMNLIHRRICSSPKWAAAVRDRMPGFLAGTPLGDDVLEIGPGFGATTRAMVDHLPALTCVEIDPASVERLRAEFGDRVDVVLGDGAALPFPDGRFSAVVCFTMLHHVPSAQQQDALFAEAARVLRPGGVFAGLDSQPSLRFRFLHIGDTMTVVDPATLPGRLGRAGLVDVAVTRAPGQVLFSAYRPV
ncbi:MULTISPECIES: class I SAM-dependent methyltransferase [unclassified Pseudonocardia]|jgi:SAM-dependent methyltransferase|uniref:class I SAM-dependent methyltransferase n=1 Tax=unclassified Pseudonocardia TaxID=2619320 RepID=UPI000967E465|nr:MULTISPECIES: class I SAM-dependent methyltransferase [unclassified Pseudonocardia]MBN9100868.1 class I SAM-dependent methyltransferase [Pseudonocardia sp.]OJY51624.1 MAG: methyltransferase type 11 [Pseudonocardia sp. 73-21]